MPAYGTGDRVHDVVFKGVRVAGRSINSHWDICCKNGFITSIEETKLTTIKGSCGGFLIPSLCHPHIHLDKCFLLSHPKYDDLEMQTGDFVEALSLTSRSDL